MTCWQKEQTESSAALAVMAVVLDVMAVALDVMAVAIMALAYIESVNEHVYRKFCTMHRAELNLCHTKGVALL